MHMNKQKEAILTTFKNTTKSVLDVIESLDEDQLNQPTSGVVWSPIEILEHLYRSEIGYVKLFSGPSKPVEDRISTAKISQFESAFSDNDKSYKAPEIIQPKNELSTSSVISNYSVNRERITTLINKSRDKLDHVMQEFAHPFFGYLTGLEWVAFSNVHTHRHIEQIKQRANHI